MPGGALVIGESLVDMIGTADDDGRLLFRPRAGGSPLNVAVGARRLGVDITLATAIAEDSFGRRLRQFLADEGVSLLTTPDQKRGTCLAVVTRIGEHVEFEYFGDPASMIGIGPVDPEVVRGSAIVHAGSTAFLGQPVLSTVAAAYSIEGPFRTADPNPRSFLIEDRARYKARLDEVMAMADLIKLSAEDLAYLYPEWSVERTCEHLLRLGARVVIVTRAVRDTAVATRDGQAWVAVPETEAIDPTGAGDSFTANLIADICRDGVPSDLEAWSAAAWRADVAASLTCASVGGAESMPDRAAVSERVDALGQDPSSG